MTTPVKYATIVLGVFVAVAFLLILSEFKYGARFAQAALVVAILIVALRHSTQLTEFFQSIEGNTNAP